MAVSNLAATPVLQYWETQEGQIPESRLYQVTATLANVPVENDLCHLDASGLMEKQITTAGSATAAARTIAGVCLSRLNPQGRLYNPGFRAGDYENVARMTYGGQGSHVNATGAVNQKFFVPMKPTLSWVMTRYTDDAVVVGQSYGARTTAAGVWFLDASITDDTLTVLGTFSPDVDGMNGPAFKAIPRVWVKAFLTPNL